MVSIKVIGRDSIEVHIFVYEFSYTFGYISQNIKNNTLQLRFKTLMIFGSKHALFSRVANKNTRWVQKRKTGAEA
jgi:hypothetical protein